MANPIKGASIAVGGTVSKSPRKAKKVQRYTQQEQQQLQWVGSEIK
jgi:hypothetical protein